MSHPTISPPDVDTALRALWSSSPGGFSHTVNWSETARLKAELGERGLVPCYRCGGARVYAHYGTCFRCGGRGSDPDQPKHPAKSKKVAQARRFARAYRIAEGLSAARREGISLEDLVNAWDRHRQRIERAA